MKVHPTKALRSLVLLDLRSLHLAMNFLFSRLPYHACAPPASLLSLQSPPSLLCVYTFLLSSPLTLSITHATFPHLPVSLSRPLSRPLSPLHPPPPLFLPLFRDKVQEELQSIGSVKEELGIVQRIRPGWTKLLFWRDDYLVRNSLGPQKSTVIQNIANIQPTLSLSPSTIGRAYMKPLCIAHQP